jgi:hypothetical protein
MIRILAITLGTLALAIPADARGKGKGKGGGKRGVQVPAELVAKYDTNGDGKLDKQERAAISDEDRANFGKGHGKGKGNGKGKGKGNGKGNGKGKGQGRGL